jgi:hypothetical protein
MMLQPGAPLRRYLDRRINIEEKIKGPVRLDLQIFGGGNVGAKQETLQVRVRLAYFVTWQLVDTNELSVSTCKYVDQGCSPSASTQIQGV